MDTDGDYEKSLKHQIEMQRTKIEVLERTCADYQQGIREMKSLTYIQPSDEQKSVQVYKEMLQQMQKKNVELETEKIALQVSISRLEEVQAELRAQLEKSESACLGFKQSHMSLTAERNELERSYLIQLEEKEKQIKAFEKELVDAKNEIIQVRLEFGNHRQLQSDHEQLKQTHEQLSKHYEALYLQTTEIINGIQVLNDQAKENTTLIEDLKKKLVDSKGRVETLELFNDDLSQQKMMLEAKITELEIKKCEFNQCLNELNVLRATKFDNDQLVKQLRQYEMEINEKSLLIEKITEAKEFLAENNSMLVTNTVRMKMFLEKLGYSEADVAKHSAIQEYDDMRKALEHNELQVRELEQLNFKLNLDLENLQKSACRERIVLEETLNDKIRVLEVELAALKRGVAVSIRIESETQTDGEFVNKESLDRLELKYDDEMKLLQEMHANETARFEFRFLQLQGENDRYLAELEAFGDQVRGLKSELNETRQKRLDVQDSSTQSIAVQVRSNESQTAELEVVCSFVQTDKPTPGAQAETQTDESTETTLGEPAETQTDLGSIEFERLSQIEANFSALKSQYDQLIVRNEELNKMNEMFRIDVNRLTEKFQIANMDAQTQSDDMSGQEMKIENIEKTYEMVNDWANESDPLIEPFETIEMKLHEQPTPPSESYTTNADTNSNGTNSCSISQVNINMLESNLNELIENYKHELNQMEENLAQREQSNLKLQQELATKQEELSELLAKCESLERENSTLQSTCNELKSKPTDLNNNNNNNNNDQKAESGSEQESTESLGEKLKALQQQNLKYKAKLKLLLAENKTLNESVSSARNEPAQMCETSVQTEIEKSVETPIGLQSQQTVCHLQAELQVHENNLNALSKENKKISSENDRLKVLLELKQRFNDQMVRELETKASVAQPPVQPVQPDADNEAQVKLERLEGLNSDYLRQIDDLESQRDLKASQLEDIIFKFTEFRQKHSELQQCCDENEKNLKEEIQYLFELVEVKKEEIEQLKKEKSELETIRDELSQQTVEVKESNDKLNETVNELDEKSESLSSELSRIKQDHDSQLGKLQEEIQELTNQLDELKAQHIEVSRIDVETQTESQEEEAELKEKFESLQKQNLKYKIKLKQLLAASKAESANEDKSSQAKPECTETGVQTEQPEEETTATAAAVEEAVLVGEAPGTKTMPIAEYEALYAECQLALKQKNRLEFYLHEKETEIYELNREMNLMRSKHANEIRGFETSNLERENRFKFEMDQLNTSVESKQAMIGQLNDELVLANEKYERTQKYLELQLAEKDERLSQLESSNQSFVDLKDELDALEAEKKELVNTIMLKDEHINQLNSSMRMLESSMDAHNGSMEVDESLRQARDQLETEIAAQNEKIRKIEDECQELRARNQELYDEINRKADTIASFEQELSVLKTTIQSQTEEFERNIRSLQTNLDEQINEKEQHLAKLTSQENYLADLEEMLSTKEDLLSVLNTELAETKTKYEADLREQADKQSTWETERKESDDLISELRVLLQEKEAELNGLREELRVAREECEALHARLNGDEASRTEELVELTQNLENVSVLSEELEFKLSKALQEKATLEQQLMSFNKKCALFKSKIIELNRQNDTLTDRILAIKAVF